jgi:hypothetical protein
MPHSLGCARKRIEYTLVPPSSVHRSSARRCAIFAARKPCRRCLDEPRWSTAGGLSEGLEMSVFSHGVCFASEPYDPADMGPITVSASTTVTPDPARAGALLPVRSRAARDFMCGAPGPAGVQRVVWLRQLQMLAKSKWSAMRAVGARQPEDDSEDDQCRLLQSS